MPDSPLSASRLAYSAPPEALAQELREVANAAAEFDEAIRAANDLPAQFPKVPTLLIAAALAELPQGTGEGAYEPLIYARNRLAALRRSFILTEAASLDAPTGDDHPPPLTRGLAIDLALTRLVADIGTALDAYRAIASREEDERADLGGAVRVDPADPDVRAAADRAGATQKALEEGARQIRKIVEPTSRVGDDLARQTQDAAALIGLGRAELSERRVVPQWMRRLVATVTDYPNLMRKTAGAIQMGVDVARPARQIWSDFKRGCFEALAKAAESTAHELKTLADKWEGERAERKPIPPPASKIGDFTYGKAREMILRGEPPPAEWTPMIDYLDLSGERDFTHVEALRGLKALTTLNLSLTQVSDVSALSGLTALTSLYLYNTKVSEVSALSGLTALISLNLSSTEVSDVSALSGLTALISLDLSETQVSDVSALSGLTALTWFNLSNTQVSDVSALSGLTALTSLDLIGTQVSDVTALSGLTALIEITASKDQREHLAASLGARGHIVKGPPWERD